MDEQKPSTVTELYPSKYLTADDLHGRSYKLQVRAVEVEKMRDAFTHTDEWKAVLHFVNAKKGLVLNKTQVMKMRELTGSEVLRDWRGEVVVLAPGFTRNGKKTIVISGTGDAEEVK